MNFMDDNFYSGGKDKLMLSASQCKYLARRAIVLNYY